MKHYLLLFASIAACASVSADDVTVGNWSLELSDFGDGKSISSVKSGSGALDLSTNTEILNIEPKAFAGNKNLTSIILPSTLQSTRPLEYVEHFSRETSGEDNGTTGLGISRYVNLDPVIKAQESFIIKATITFDNWDANKNTQDYYVGEWGSAIMAAGTNPIDQQDNYVNQKKFQIWLNSKGKKGNTNLNMICSRGSANTLYTNVMDDCDGKIEITLDYNGDEHALTTTVTTGGKTQKYRYAPVDMNAISAVSHNLRRDVNLKVSLVGLAPSADPFVGCTSLDEIGVSNNVHFAIAEHGSLMHGGNVLSFPIASLYNKLVHLNFDDGNSLRCASIMDGNGKIWTGTAANRTFVADSPASHHPGASLFCIENVPNRGIEIYAVNTTVGKKEVVHGSASSPGYLTADNNPATLTFNRDWGTIYTITPTYSEHELQFTFKNAGNTYLGPGTNNATAHHITVEPVEGIDVALTGGHAMVCLPIAVDAVEGCYTVSSVANGTVQYKAIEEETVIKAETPFMIKSSEDVVTLPVSQAVAMDDSETKSPIFHGTCISIAAGAHNGEFYTYNGTAFEKKTTSDVVPTGAAYLKNTNGEDWGANDGILTLASQPIATSISEVNAGKCSDGAVYDLQGRRLAAPVKGINIISGRKVLVK